MPAQDPNNIKGNQFDVYIDHGDAPFQLTVNAGPALVLENVETQRLGKSPIGAMVTGHMTELTFEFQEWTKEDIKRWNGITAVNASQNYLPPVGTLMPKHHIRLHNRGDGADTTKDICYPAVSFRGMALSIDGGPVAKQQVSATAFVDLDSGHSAIIGYVAPEV